MKPDLERIRNLWNECNEKYKRALEEISKIKQELDSVGLVLGMLIEEDAKKEKGNK